MPIYCYKCPKCRTVVDLPRVVDKRNDPAECPDCLGVAARDVRSEGVHTDMGYDVEMRSEALGVHPSQIAEATQRFPHHKFTPDGRMRIGSHQEFKRVLKDLGFHDRHGFS